MRLALAVLAATFTAAPALARTDYAPRDAVEVANAEWTRDAVLYQLNTRQFTPEAPSRRRRNSSPALPRWAWTSSG